MAAAAAHSPDDDAPRRTLLGHTAPEAVVPPSIKPKQRDDVAKELEKSAQEFQLEVGGLLAFAEFMDEHGDRHMQAVAGAARTVFRRINNYGELFENFARALPKRAE